MASSMPPVVRQQLTRVARRLFLQTLLDTALWGLVGALVLALVWLLAEPWLPGERTDALRWGVVAGLAALGLAGAAAVAVLRAPSRLAAALLLDERFGLRERVTTSLTLDGQQALLPAGQALLEDVNDRVARLDVAERFPLQVKRHAWLVPAGALALAAVGVFYDPPRSVANPTPTDELAKAPANKAEIDKAMRDLEKKARDKKAEKAVGEKLDPLDDELQKLLNRPRDTQEDVKDRIKDLTKLEEKIRDKQDALAEKAQAIKDQLRQMNKMAGMDPKNGPAKDLQKAVDKGDFNKAQEEVERLAKKVREGELNDEQKEQLREQMKDMKEKLQRLANPEQEEERLKELHREGKIDKEQLQREMDNLKKNSQQMSPDDQERLKEISDALQQCEKCMKEGDKDGAADALQKAGQCLKKMDDLDNLKDLDEQLEQLQGARRSMCKGMGDPQPIPGEGRRPDGDPEDTKSFNSRVRGDFDPKGQKELTGYAPGAAFKKKSSAELAGEIKQASQEAPEALDRQRIPRAAADMAKGYFENFRKMSGDKE